MAPCVFRGTAAISARRPPAAHALTGLPDGAGLVPMDPAEVPNQSEPRRRAARDHQPAFRGARARCVEKADLKKPDTQSSSRVFCLFFERCCWTPSPSVILGAPDPPRSVLDRHSGDQNSFLATEACTILVFLIRSRGVSCGAPAQKWRGDWRFLGWWARPVRPSSPPEAERRGRGGSGSQTSLSGSQHRRGSAPQDQAPTAGSVGISRP